MNHDNARASHSVWRAGIGFLVYLLLVPTTLFVAAGSLNWPMAWLFVGLMLGSAIGSRVIVWQRFPDLLRERSQFTAAQGALSLDRLLAAVVGLYGPLATVLVAGLDRRYSWSTAVPLTGQIVAALLLLAGYALAVWAMVVNRFFSAVVRLQPARGHQVVSDGPYRYVRHPAYTGAVLSWLALPVQLSTLWALGPAVLVVGVLVVRTRLEDDLLQRELPGYLAYTARTPYRLVPGIW